MVGPVNTAGSRLRNWWGYGPAGPYSTPQEVAVRCSMQSDRETIPLVRNSNILQSRWNLHQTLSLVAVWGPNANEASTTKAGIFLNIVFWDTFVIHHGLMISLLCDAPIGKCGTLIRFWLRPWNWPSVSSAGKITRDFLKSPMTLNLSLVTKVTACGQNQKRGVNGQDCALPAVPGDAIWRVWNSFCGLVITGSYLGMF